MNTWNKFLRVSVGLLTMTVIAALCAPGAYAQGSVSRYTLTTETGTWIDATASGTRLGAADDNSWAFSLPFGVVYDSTTISAGTTVAMTDDGDFSFKNFSGGYSYCTVEPGSSTYPGAIGVFNIDWIFNTTSSPYGDWWAVTGSSPNRILTMEWYQNTIYAGSTTTNFELQIHETSGVIEILYADHSVSTGTSDCGNGAYVGLNGMTTPATDYIVAASAVTSLPSTDFKFTPPSAGPATELSLTPKSVNFGTYAVGQTNTICTFTARNVGVATLHIQGVGIKGAPNYQPDFKVVSGPLAGDSITVGNSKSWCVQFSPITAGPRLDSFYVITDGKDSGAQATFITGFGIAPAVTYGATTLFRGIKTELGDTSQAQYLTVASNGTGPLTFNAIYFIGLDKSSYEIVHSPPNPMPLGTTDSIGVKFLPTVEGRPDATLIISTNAVNLPNDTLIMYGIGVLPHLAITLPSPSIGNTLNFDSVALGDSVCQTITLYNPGSDTLFLLRQLLTSGDYDFTFYPLKGTDTAILPGASKLINVCFKPLRSGTRLASLRFFTSIPLTFTTPQKDTSQFPISVIGIGVPSGQLSITGPAGRDTAQVGKQVCMTDTLWNTGQASLTVTGVTITGADSSEFSYSGLSFPLTLQPGTNKPFRVCATLTADGSQTATLTASGTTNETTPISASYPLSVYGTTVCDTLAFATKFSAATCMGTSDTATITVTNCGNVPAIYSATITGPNAAQFAIVGPATSGSESGGAMATFKVAYTPDANDATSTATFNIAGGPGGMLTLTGARSSAIIAGNGTAPTTPVGMTSPSFTATVNNTGECAWTPGGAALFSNAAFTYVSGGTTPIAPGGNAQITFKFSPTQVGANNSSVSFPLQVGVSIPPANVQLTGTATPGASVPMVSAQSGYSIDQTYPNPTTGTSYVEITLPNADLVHLAILDISGHVVENVLDQQFEAGTFSVKIDANDLASGAYFYQMTSGGVQLTRQMTIVK